MRNNHRPKPRDDLLEIWQVCWPQHADLFSLDNAPAVPRRLLGFRQFHFSDDVSDGRCFLVAACAGSCSEF